MADRTPRLRGKEWDTLRIATLNRDGWTCAYCGKHLEGKDAQADHILALENGGENALYNLVAACGKCNGTKSD